MPRPVQARRVTRPQKTGGRILPGFGDGWLLRCGMLQTTYFGARRCFSL